MVGLIKSQAPPVVVPAATVYVICNDGAPVLVIPKFCAAGVEPLTELKEIEVGLGTIEGWVVTFKVTDTGIGVDAPAGNTLIVPVYVPAPEGNEAPLTETMGPVPLAVNVPEDTESQLPPGGLCTVADAV